MEWVGEHGWQPLDVCIDWQDNPSRLDNLGSLDNLDVVDDLGSPDNLDVVDDLRGVDNFDSIAMRCNLVSSGETYWHLEGCLNLQTACALS